MCIDYCRSALLMERSLRDWHPHMPERPDREEVADWITCPHGKAHLAGAPAPAAELLDALFGAASWRSCVSEGGN
jgi:hypothetical protein